MATMVASQQGVPFARPNHFDHIPAGPAEKSLEFLHDLAVTAHRSIETLEIAIDNKSQVIKPLAGP